MADLTVCKDTELRVAHVEANSDPGVALVDAFTSPTMIVLDSGVIVVSLDDLPRLLNTAAGLEALVFDVTVKT